MGRLDARKVQELVIQNARSQPINLMNDAILGFDNHFESISSSSYKRVNHHLSNDNPLFVIAVARDYKNAQEIKDEIDELKITLRDYGLGFIPLMGTYKHKDGTVETELSFFVPYFDGFTGYHYFGKNNGYRVVDFTEFGIDLGEVYDQESVLVKTGTVGGKFHTILHFIDGSEKVIAENPTLSFNQLANGASRLFEG